ncbi:peptidyl-prolyl cis-trans isomerase, partial [Candidatus Sumerlaeota bacterium]|nr:peptidyl-prolyl cis-trans isomerase [Candidatus Sumerlaeota bacterium]
MLKRLRSQKVMRRVLRITLILVIPSFVFYYGWSSSRRSALEKSRYFAKIKLGKLARWHEITPAEIREAQTRLLINFSNFAQLMGIPQQLFLSSRMVESIPHLAKITEAVNFYLLLYFAQKYGITTSRDEIILQFRNRWPQNTAANLRNYMNRRGFNSEAELILNERRYTTANKVKYVFYSQAQASLFELWQQYLITDEKIKIAYIRIPIEELKKKISPTEEDLATFYEQNKEKYREPEKYIFNYTKLLITDVVTTVTVSDEEVTRFYEENKERYKLPKRVKVRHILVEVPPDAKPEQVDKLRSKAESLFQRAKQGESFEELANLYSDEYDADRVTTPIKTGGLLGWITPRDASVYGKEFVSTVLQMENPGDITPPFRTPKGFEIVKAEEIKPESYLPLDDIAPSLKSFLFRKRCKEIIDRKASEFSQNLYKYTSVEAIAKELNKPLLQTDAVEAGQYIFPDIGNLTPYRNVIDEMIQSKEIQIFPLTTQAVFMQLREVIPSTIPPLDEIKDKVADDCAYEKSVKMAREIAQTIKEESSSTETLMQAGLKQGFEMKTTDYFTRDKLPPELGNIRIFFHFTFKTKVVDILFSESRGGQYN